MQPTSSTRKPRASSQARIAAILDAARGLLADEGIGGLTIYSVAERAEMPPSSVYHFFPSVPALLQGLTGEVHAAFRACLEQPVDHAGLRCWRDLSRIVEERMLAVYARDAAARQLILASHGLAEVTQADRQHDVQLGQALGYRLDGPALAVDEWQAGSLPDHYAAGECTGFGGSELALVEGAIAGHAAVDERDAARRLWPRRRRWQGFADTLARHFALRAELRQLAEADTLVCRCEDVPLAALAGHAGWTEAKLHSRCGMGACQGRICGGAAQFLFGWTPPAPRPPFSPARLETLARWQGDAG